MFNRAELCYHVALPAYPILEERAMVTAFVLISAKRNLIPETAQALSELEGVAEVYSVAGEFDLVAVIRVRTNEELADLVTGHLLKLKGIERTETLIAFRAYSKFDLERMFSIGLE
jgi:DNA-binding Lrp family transcriptional regulator